MMNKRKTALSLIIALILLLPLFTFALKEDYKLLTAQGSLPASKEFVIKFEQPLNKATVNSSNVYVLNSKGIKVATTASLSSDGKSIIIKPADKYSNNSSYTLYIRKSVKYTTGKQLRSGIKMDFSIAPYKEGLPVVASREKLLQLLTDAEKQLTISGGKLRGGIIEDLNFNVPWAKTANNESATPAAAPPGQSNGKESAAYSTTNIQVNGVDEADIVKTDGAYIYQVKSDGIAITKAYPADKLEVVKTLSYGGKLQPVELYVDDRNMVVIGSSHMENYNYEKGIMPRYVDSIVIMKIYDISDKSKIEEIREIQLDGRYLSSRKVGSELYLIANKYINRHVLRQDEKAPDTPLYRDSQIGQEFVKVGYDDVRYFPDSVMGNYMVVAGLSLDTPKEKLNVDTYLGAGEEIFCSQDNLYAAVTQYNTKQSKPDPIVYDSAVAAKQRGIVQYSQETMIYRFALNRGKLEYVTKGTVPGKILNQFSMDEHDGSFRIATTKDETWMQGDETSKNNLYILDMSLKQLGSIEDIAPGEKIYSVRFMGDRAYMVTFRTVDPLFVIDLKDKAKPKILGALKIPGYSDYLHPYDENHIIGFGKDTVEVVHRDNNGNESYRNAYYLGMKIAMFDITDVSKPKELFVEKIGDRGTESPLLQDHKALLFSKEKNLMAFPVTVMELAAGTKQNYGEAPPHGSFTFQGAYVYNVDLQKGFQLRSKITHLSQEEYAKAGEFWYEDSKNVQRIIYIGNNLYTISNNMIKAHDLTSLKEIKSVEIR